MGVYPGDHGNYGSTYCIHIARDTQRSIIESVDSISRDGPDTSIYVIHYKKSKISEQVSL